MALNLQLPEQPTLTPSITVFGVGGAGGNAVNNMISANLEGVKFVIANTDAQALENALPEHKIQLGAELTKGLGAGSAPEVGAAAAEETINTIVQYLENCNMVFITAGMGGGTGTGAAPVIARLARERGILTVGVVTKPFHFEGSRRMKIAELGVSELQKTVDTLIVIPNQNLFRIANEKTTFGDAFKMADDVLHAGVRGITDLITMPGLINLDFADVRSVMSEMGKAMMGTGDADGDNRAVAAAEAAISNPLLDNVSMQGARGVLINITGGPDMTLFEVDEAANRVREEIDSEANIIFGSTFNPEMEGKMRISVIATGIDAGQSQPQQQTVNLATQGQATATPITNATSTKTEISPTPQPAATATNFANNTATPNTTTITPTTPPPTPQPSTPEEAFIPPPVVEPKRYPSDTNQETSSQPPKEKRIITPTPTKNNTSETQATAPSGETMVEERPQPATVTDDDFSEDILNIPAFLRRKTE